MWDKDKPKEPDPAIKALEDKIAAQDEKLKKLDLLDNISTGFDEIRQKIASIEAGGQQAADDQQQQQRQQQQADKGEMTSFLVDENRAFAERAMPLAAMQLQTAAKVAKMAARSKVLLSQKEGDPYFGQRMARFFDKHETEIDAYAKNVPLANQSHDETWLNMFKLVQADHLDELSGDKKVPFVEGGIGGTAPTNIETTGKGDNLTDEEKKVAGRLGVSEADYLKSRKEMVYS